MRIFLSHVSEEAPEAQALKRVLEEGVPGVNVFVSAVDIHLGDAWLKQIDEALTDAKAVLALCSPNSVRRPWLNFESGSGWSKQLPVIPICHKGMRKDWLPDPMRIFQAIELTSAASFADLVSRLADVLGTRLASKLDAEQMFQALTSERPPRGMEIGIVLCYRQNEWEPGNRSVFALAKALPNDLDGKWDFRPLDDRRVFLSPDLHKFSGLIMANPWRAAMEPETIAAIVEWVRAGGRLLLLGFELGDRHHDGNLGELSHHFGIDPAGNIVGPRECDASKPYNTPVDFSPADADPHPFTDGLTTIRLANVQTLQVLPGGTEWLRVGHNVVYLPRRGTVQYHDGTMTTPGGSAFESNDNASWLPVAAEVPQGLCGAGGVQMIGTWDLVGRHQAFIGDNLVLVRRLLDWLSRRSG